jgi:predicted NBD/HSP70 family sugar kinase
MRPVSEGGRRVLDLLLKNGALSQAQITRSLDLAQPTIARLIHGFQADGMVRVEARQADRPGNPSVNVSLNPDFAYAFGISMMGDKLSMTLLDFAGCVRGIRVAAMPDMRRFPVLERLTAFRADLLKKAGIDPRRVIGAGIGLSGFYVGERNWLNPPSSLDDWALIDIEPILEEALGLPVKIDNDGNVAAIGESLFGVGRRCRDFAYLHLTNGFGGGLIADGKPFRGHHGNAGEFGGVWALTETAYPNLDFLQRCLREQGHMFATVEDMVQIIDVGWAGVEGWLEQAVGPFARLCAILAFSFDPEMIVIGGRLPVTIAQALVKQITIPSGASRRGRHPPLPQIVVGEAPGDPVGLGAAVIPLRDAFFA